MVVCMKSATGSGTLARCCLCMLPVEVSVRDRRFVQRYAISRELQLKKKARKLTANNPPELLKIRLANKCWLKKGGPGTGNIRISVWNLRRRAGDQNKDEF